MRTILTAVAGSMLLASTSAGFAHVTVTATSTRADSTQIVTYRVPHGCAGDATTAFRVQIPQGMTGVKPMPHAGWELEIVTGSYITPVSVGDNTIAEGVTEVIWSGGNLPDAFYDEFKIRGRLPAGEPGTVVYFPAVQECAATGATDAWIVIPVEGQEEPEFPAPKLTLTAE
jgi:uncharacterized protein YcnI